MCDITISRSAQIHVLRIPTLKTKCWTARRRGPLCIYGVKPFDWYLESLLWYCNAENLEHLWRVMFDMRSETNKVCTNLYQTSISTNGAKIILKKHGPKQQDSCMQMRKTKPVNLKWWTIRIRFHICKLIMIYRAVENLRHNHQPIDTNTRAANSDLENKMLDCATPWCALYIWCQIIWLVSRIASMILQCQKFRTFMTRDVWYAFWNQ